ncbi:MAG: hypothetical protein V9H69_17795 [Anaerolineae bacterium]
MLAPCRASLGSSEPKEPRPEVIASIEWFKKQFARSRFDQSWYESPVSIVTPESPEILTTIDFVRDYPQPDLIEPLLNQINASQLNLAAYQMKLSDADWPVLNPFNPVTSRYTGLPALIAASVDSFAPNEDSGGAAGQEMADGQRPRHHRAGTTTRRRSASGSSSRLPSH